MSVKTLSRMNFNSAGTTNPLLFYSVELYAWGGGAGGGLSGGAGGGSGAAYGIYNITPSSIHLIVIGGGGTSHGPNGGTGSTVLGGGGLAAAVGYAGQGGGYSGIFKTSVSQANAILIAGGGGGGGAGNSGGGGGGSDGVIGGSHIQRREFDRWP